MDLVVLVAQWYGFLIFFGLLIPLALASPGGIVYPPLFALGTALPVLAILAALSFGLRDRAGAVGMFGGIRPFLTSVAGLVLVLTGLNDTVVYWFL